MADETSGYPGPAAEETAKATLTQETDGWISGLASCRTEIWRLHLRLHYKKLRGRYVIELVTLAFLGCIPWLQD